MKDPEDEIEISVDCIMIDLVGAGENVVKARAYCNSKINGSRGGMAVYLLEDEIAALDALTERVKDRYRSYIVEQLESLVSTETEKEPA